MFNYEGYAVAEHCIGALQLYIDHGIEPGSFMEAMLSNDLRGACAMSDEENRHCIFEWVNLFYNELPSDSWGSPEKYRNWIKRGGLSYEAGKQS